MKKKIVFTGGGTLGHVMPNLYLIEELKDIEPYYIGSNGIEKDLIIKKEINFFSIPTIKLVRGKIFTNFKIPFVLVDSILKAKKYLKEIKPDLIFSKGGYVSLPVCIAGRMLKIPIIAHESDFSFGLANKIILKVCNTMCVNFKNLENKNKKIVYTGPIFSKEFENNTKKTNIFNLDSNKKTILFIGGSLGSKKINEVLYPIIRDLLKQFNIIHITGKGNNKLKSFDNYNAIEMYDKMHEIYNLADFVIGRSGAGVSSECFYKSIPMLLIPLQNKSSRGDQLQNAKYYENMKVARILLEENLTPTKMYEGIINFDKNLDVFKASYKDIKNINGKKKIIELIYKYLSNSQYWFIFIDNIRN